RDGAGRGRRRVVLERRGTGGHRPAGLASVADPQGDGAGAGPRPRPSFGTTHHGSRPPVLRRPGHPRQWTGSPAPAPARAPLRLGSLGRTDAGLPASGAGGDRGIASDLSQGSARGPPSGGACRSVDAGRRLSALMRRIQTVNAMRTWSRGLQRKGVTIGLVPTMGALHEGHRSLIRAARLACDAVAVSIFVNPLQFGPLEDFDRYPRSLAQDLRLCRSAGGDTVFIPRAQEMYPADFDPAVSVHR